MGVFLSKNNKEPYQTIDTLHYPVIDLVVYGKDVIDDVIVYEDYFYVVFEKGGVYENVEVEVSIDYSLGVSIEIAKTDLAGNPIKWGTKVVLGSVDASSNTQKYLIAYRWRLINNIYIIKPGKKVALITITSTTQ